MKIIYIILIFSLFNSNNIFSQRLHPIKKKDREAIQRFVFIDEETGRPFERQCLYKTPNSIFLIHYDTSGVHSVNKTDLNKNNVPDYVDSVAFYFEKAYFFQVNELKMKSPYPDDGTGGGNEYDIYLWDLGNADDPNSVFFDNGGSYGFTYDYKDFFGSKFPKSYTYIVIDNDYSPLDSATTVMPPFQKRPAYYESGMDALKITAIHELHHAIQLRYGKSYPTNLTIMEMCAMGMEMMLYPETKDYLQHTNKIIQNLSIYTFGLDDQYTGYGFSIFNQYLLKKYPDANIITRLWELVEKGLEVYSALDSTLKENGSSLNNDFCEFSEWLYYTGSRYKPNLLWHANEIAEMKFFDTKVFNDTPISTSSKLKPYEIRGIRFIIKGKSEFTDDTLDIILTNKDLLAASSASDNQLEYFLSLSNTNSANSIKLDGYDDLYLNIQIDDKICFKIYQHFGEQTRYVNYAFPSPFNLNKDLLLYFEAPRSSIIGEKLNIQILNSDMVPVFNTRKPIVVNNGILCIGINLLEEIKDISTGVYFYNIEYKESNIFGKFSIINK